MEDAWSSHLSIIFHVAQQQLQQQINDDDQRPAAWYDAKDILYSSVHSILVFVAR